MSDSVDSRCRWTFRDGRRCRMICSPQDCNLCVPHLRAWLKQQGLLARESPVVVPGDLDNPWAVRRQLKRMMHAVSNGQLPAGRARVMAQIGGLLLVSTRRKPARRKKRPDVAAPPSKRLA